MSLTIIGQWSLKDKNGKPPTPQIVDFIKKLDKKSLLPCPRSADDLQMPEKGTVPREMNSFIVFRRQLAYVAKFQKTSDDGRVISTAASYIWNGASKSEKDSYTLIAEELKRRHRVKYPNYTYERRKRKTQEEDFIVYSADIIQNNNNKNRKKRKPSPDSRSVQHVSEEQKVAPISTILPQENNEWLNNSFSDNNLCYYDNDCYTSANCYDGQVPCELIPQLYQTVIATNYTQNTIAPQELLLFQQPEQQLSSLTWDFDTFNTFDTHSFYHGNPDVGIAQPSYEGLERPIDELTGLY